MIANLKLDNTFRDIFRFITFQVTFSCCIFFFFVVYEIPQWWSDFYIALTPNYFVVAIISQMLEVE